MRNKNDFRMTGIPDRSAVTFEMVRDPLPFGVGYNIQVGAELYPRDLYIFHHVKAISLDSGKEGRLNVGDGYGIEFAEEVEGGLKVLMRSGREYLLPDVTMSDLCALISFCSRGDIVSPLRFN